MKFIKKLLMLLVILLVLTSAGILVCALNPALTGKLAAIVQSWKQPVEGPSDLEAEGLSQDLTNMGYFVPESMPQRVPDRVSGVTGYQPMQGQT